MQYSDLFGLMDGRDAEWSKIPRYQRAGSAAYSVGFRITAIHQTKQKCCTGAGTELLYRFEFSWNITAPNFQISDAVLQSPLDPSIAKVNALRFGHLG